MDTKKLEAIKTVVGGRPRQAGYVHAESADGILILSLVAEVETLRKRLAGERSRAGRLEAAIEAHHNVMGNRCAAPLALPQVIAADQALYAAVKAAS